MHTGLAKWRVTWLIEHSTSHRLLWLNESFELRNPPLRQAPKRSSESLLVPPLRYGTSKTLARTFPGITSLVQARGKTLAEQGICKIQ